MSQRIKKQPSAPKFALYQELSENGQKRIVGIDEVGRGAIAGPLVVCAVEIPTPLDGIHDSKLLSWPQRTNLARQIRSFARQITFGYANNMEIDQLGTSAALHLAYARCLEKVQADIILTDHIQLKTGHTHIRSVQGDRLFYPVAAASIVAKTYRDQLMTTYSRFFSEYSWHKNVGYGTREHFLAVKKSGPSPLHRRSFL